jgi:hypothetical protein
MGVQNRELKSFLDSAKRETRLLGSVERFILSKPFELRSQDVLHPSDLIKPEWCALAAYHALQGNYVETRDKPTLRTQSIFDEGHAIHAKWQTYLKDMGVLYGYWSNKKWGLSKDMPSTVKYKEVPLKSAKHKISGHSDGWVKGLGEDFLIEIKSIGSGTIRMEAPYLLADADNDLEKAWRNIRMPFRTHMLQGQVYLHLCHLMVEEGIFESAPKEIVFIYELKANQDYREFIVKYNPEFIEDIFEKALDVSWAVDNNRPPMCSINAEKGCKRCAPFRGGNNESN